MDEAPNLKLPYIIAAQAQKHVTHNEAIRNLDAIVQLGVLDRDLTTPPGSPDDGDRYIVAAGAVGAWAGKDDFIAAFQDNAWMFYEPVEGWLCWVSDEDRLLVWDGAAWDAAAGESINPAPLVGVNATADSTNRLAVSSPASLFNHEGAGHQVKVNKNTVADTASFLFQTDWSGRAEIGLAGDDDFHFKVSPDGSAWHEGLIIDKDTGEVSFPSGGVREPVKANRTYYVATDGSDADDGLSSEGAFATPQKAMDVISGTLDLGIYNVTVQIADGTYTGQLRLKSYLSGGGKVIFAGNAANKTAVELYSAAIAVFSNPGDTGLFRFQDLKLSAGSMNCLVQGFGANVGMTGITFGGGNARYVEAKYGGYVQLTGTNYVDGDVSVGFWATRKGTIFMSTSTLVFNNAVTISARLMNASESGWLDAYGMSFTNPGNVTGMRYQVAGLGGIFTNGGGETYFPSTVNGSVASGGVYY